MTSLNLNLGKPAPEFMFLLDYFTMLVNRNTNTDVNILYLALFNLIVNNSLKHFTNLLHNFALLDHLANIKFYVGSYFISAV